MKAVSSHPGATLAWLPAIGALVETSPFGKLSLAIMTSRSSYSIPWIRQLAVFGITSAASADFMDGPYQNNRLASDEMSGPKDR